MSQAYIRSGSGIIVRDRATNVTPEPTIVSVEVQVELDHLKEVIAAIHDGVEEAIPDVFQEQELPPSEQPTRRKRGRRPQSSAGESHD